MERSAEHIFGESTGDPLAERIWQMLADAGQLTRGQICDLLGRHQSRGRIEQALLALAARGRATADMRSSGGRPTEVWSAAR